MLKENIRYVFLNYITSYKYIILRPELVIKLKYSPHPVVIKMKYRFQRNYKWFK
ncbi:hypothetical protein LEP1GSC013_4646 [Leptospira interrogans serovar Valbuzzi str. Duyster]|nr:hypothetical protein LEP1GSC013_4646 [Leptospira interrogans serovar Valbuzzi str. Duyster]